MERRIALRGTQLAFSIDVPSYELENPPRRGDRVLTSAGTATVTHTVLVGREQVIWADYGSGISQPHVSEGILSVSPPEQPRRIRRHTPKGKASGWIEERVGNKNRKTPSVSYLYKWEDSEGKHSLYIKAAKVERVRQMVYEQRQGIGEVLRFLSERMF
jgi:hypothetical protein